MAEMPDGGFENSFAFPVTGSGVGESCDKRHGRPSCCGDRCCRANFIMHPDKKVGLALAILLIGVTGAFFFRNEAPDAGPRTPELVSAQKLDEKIRLKPRSPYVPEEANKDGRHELRSVPDARPGELIPQVPQRDPFARTEPLPEPIQPNAPRVADSAFPVPQPGRDPNVDDAGPQPLHTAQAGAASQAANSGTASGSGTSASSTLIQVHPVIHEVSAGETLSSIAERRMGSSRRFMQLFEANKDVLKSPDDLRPGMKLVIPSASLSAATQTGAPSQPAASSAAGAPSNTVTVPTSAGNSTTPVPPSRAADNSVSPFIRPARTPAPPVRRGASKIGKSLSQLPPPDVPMIESFDELLNPAVIASRPDQNDAVRRDEPRSETPPKPAAE